MAKINGKALTEKGVVKAQVRNGIVEREMKALASNDLKGYDRVENKNVMVKEYVSENGVVYATLTLTVSNKHPLDLAPKTTKKKVEKETFEIGD